MLFLSGPEPTLLVHAAVLTSFSVGGLSFRGIDAGPYGCAEGLVEPGRILLCVGCDEARNRGTRAMCGKHWS